MTTETKPLDKVPQPKKQTPLWSVILITTMAVLLGIAGIGLWAFTAGGYYFNSKGEIVQPYQPSDKNAPHFTADDGKEYVRGVSDGMMDQPVVKNGLSGENQAESENSGDDTGGIAYFAPMPESPSETYNGSYESEYYSGAESLAANEWVIPDLTQYDGSRVMASVSTGSFANLPDNTPTSSLGIISYLSNPIESEVGSTVESGHVNQTGNGMLSAWGYLHQAKVGMHVYQKDAEGKVHEFVIDRIRVIPQGEAFANDQDVWAKTGKHRLHMITCAGEYVGDDGTEGVGGTLWFPYTHNLDVQATAVN